VDEDMGGKIVFVIIFIKTIVGDGRGGNNTSVFISGNV
jgi:hypothetical protein